MFKSKALEKRHYAVDIAEQERLAVGHHAATLVATPASCIGSTMSIVGNVECTGPTQIFGRIEGDLRATDLVIGEGAQIEGNIQAQEVTISGRVKGTIRAIRVRLQGATVEGDIIHRTLSVDENSVFEGATRRVENPVDRRGDHTAGFASSFNATAEKTVPSPSLVPSASPATDVALQPN